jgi:CBS domain-containing protein
MLAADLITDTIAAVSETDTVQAVLNRMSTLLVSQLPVSIESRYAGLVTRQEIETAVLTDETVGSSKVAYLPVSVSGTQHIYEVIDAVSRHNLSLLPVVTESGEYQGSILLPGLLKQVGTITSAGEHGAIMVLLLALQDYSPAMLARIIEENNAKIISLFAVPDPNGKDITVTIKINTQETSSIIRTFDRYGFPVKTHFLADNQLDDFYRTRYEEFMNYMNI